jgi:hypothetical protein
MLNKKILLLIPFFLLHLLSLFSQNGSTIPKQKIAVFLPLYLDSAFDGANNYRYDKTFPKFINPGLEFFEGVQMALDSLNKEKVPLEVFVYDTRSATKTVAEQLYELDSVGLIIAYATAQENWFFAEAAKTRKIPYVNPNLPNDGGINNNPYFILLNSTLKTHVEGVYRFLQKYYSTNAIVLFRKKGMMEDMINSYFHDFGKSTASVPLKIKVVELSDSFNIKQVVNHLDSNKISACISGTLDDHFNRRLALLLASIHKIYPASMIGMPTLENISRDFTRAEFKGPEFIYSTPFYNPRTDKVTAAITEHFTTKMFARPSDMVMRGYETAWLFSKLLLKYKNELSSNITRKEFNVLCEFDIQPALNKQTNTLDYFENKKLHFIKWQDGVIKSVN